MSSHREQTAFVYSDWAIAFLDIVGFKNVVAATVRTGNSTALISDIAGALLNAKKRLQGLEAAVTEITEQTFSDTTLICCFEPPPVALVSLVSVISSMQCDMILDGYVFRGGLTAGANFRSGTTMFGPALVEAYEMEKQADWPRVLVASSVLERISGWVSEWRTLPFIAKDGQGLVYIDYLMEGCLLATAHQWAKEYEEGVASTQPSDMEFLLSRHQAVILSLRERAADSMRDLGRCHSLAQYHNRTIERLNEQISLWRPDHGILGQRRHLNYLAVRFLNGIGFGPEVQLPASWREAASAFTSSGQSHEAMTARLKEGEQATGDFTRSRLMEIQAAQDRLKRLLIDLPPNFPALYERGEAT